MRRSLRLRLLVVGAFAIVATLGGAALGLALLFERHVERVAVNDLEARALTLAGIVEHDADGVPRLAAPPADRLYQQPFSGHYWQVILGDEVQRSRSLWDYTLPMDRPAPAPGQSRVIGLPGPQGERLLAVEQGLLVGRGPDALTLRIIVASDRAVLTAARRGFLGDLLPYLAFLGLLLVAGSWLQIRIGLSPLAQVADRVQALTQGQRSRIGTDLPHEVLPLSRQLDALLDARDAELLRARHRRAIWRTASRRRFRRCWAMRAACATGGNRKSRAASKRSCPPCAAWWTANWPAPASSPTAMRPRPIRRLS